MKGKPCKILLCFYLGMVLLQAISGAEKSPAWRDGTVSDIRFERVVVDVNNNYNRVYTFSIDIGDRIVEATQTLKATWSKPARLDVNGPVKYIFDEKRPDEILILDQANKQYKLKVVKRARKA